MPQGNGKDESVVVLHEIVAEIRGLREDTNARFGEVNERFGEMNARLERVEGELHEGFAGLEAKSDSAIVRDRHLEEHVREFGERVARLEARTPER